MISKAALGVVAPLLLLASLASCGGGGGGGAPAGGGPVLIETSDAGSVSSAQVAIGADGHGLAVWIQSDGTRGNVWANRYTARTGWGTAVLIETDTGNARSPQVAIDGNGNGMAVWDQSDGLCQNVWANRFTAATGSWGPAVLIETDNTGGAISPQLGFDASGNALAVWSGNSSTWSSRYTAATGSWGTPILVETGTGSATSPQVSVAASGNAVAVWQQSDGVRDNIWANRYTATTSSWGTAVLIETDNAGGASVPRVSIDADGNALAVWVQSDGTRGNVWSNRFTAGTTNAWGMATLIETDNVGGADAPRLALDGSGNALAVWLQDGDASAVVTYDVWSCRYTAGSGWGTAALLETSALRAGGVELAMNAAGAAVAAWHQLDGTHQSVSSRRYAAGGGWGAAALAERYDGGDALSPKVAIDASGAVLLVWEQQAAGLSRLDLWAGSF